MFFTDHLRRIRIIARLRHQGITIIKYLIIVPIIRLLIGIKFYDPPYGGFCYIQKKRPSFRGGFCRFLKSTYFSIAFLRRISAPTLGVIVHFSLPEVTSRAISSTTSTPKTFSAECSSLIFCRN